jgi:hypothetical protein
MRFAIPLLALHNLGTPPEENIEVLPFLDFDLGEVSERKLEKEVRNPHF